MSKTNKILLIIFLLLFGSAYFYQNQYKNWVKNEKSEKNFLTDIDFKNIDKIIIEKGSKKSVLEKDNEQWKIEGTKNFYADKDEIENIISELEQASLKEMFLVSSKEEKKADYQTDDKGLILSLKDNKNDLLNIIVGKISDDSYTYLSLKNSENTYKIKGDLLSLLDKEDWRNKTILSFNNDEIKKIRIQKNKESITFEKKDNEWYLKKQKMNKEKIEELLTASSFFEADKIPEQKFEETGLEKNSLILELYKEEDSYVLMFGNKDKENFYYVKTGTNDNIYLINSEKFSIFNKNVSYFK
jgi:hypothetical protein